MFGWQRFGLGFDVVLHAATLAATIAYFRRDVWKLLLGLFSKGEERARDRKLAWLIIAATIPSALIALALEPLVEGVETLPMSSQVVITDAFPLMTAALLAGAELLARRAKHTIATAEEIPLKQAPRYRRGAGVRSGAGAVALGHHHRLGAGLGIKRDEARFSFLLSIPIIGAATAKKILSTLIVGGEALPAAGPLAVGTITTAIVGYMAIALRLPVPEHSLWVFAIYTAIAGTAILVMSVLT